MIVMDRSVNNKWKQKKNMFHDRVYKWQDKVISDDKMWTSIKNACKNNLIENINKSMSIKEAINHVYIQLNNLQRGCQTYRKIV